MASARGCRTRMASTRCMGTPMSTSSWSSPATRIAWRALCAWHLVVCHRIDRCGTWHHYHHHHRHHHHLLRPYSLIVTIITTITMVAKTIINAVIIAAVIIIIVVVVIRDGLNADPGYNAGVNIFCSWQDPVLILPKTARVDASGAGASTRKGVCLLCQIGHGHAMAMPWPWSASSSLLLASSSSLSPLSARPSPRHAMPCHGANLRLSVRIHVMQCHAMRCHSLPLHSMPCHVRCHVMSCHAIV